MTSATSPRHVSLIHVFLSSPGDVADERIETEQVLEELPKDLLPDGRITFEAESWDDFGCRFLAVVGASGIGKPPLVNDGPDDALGGAGQIR
jgi:hypothetical protein